MRLLAPFMLAAVMAGSAMPSTAQDVAARSAAPENHAASNSHPISVVELFTSQGCSSCPKADALMGQLAHRPDILALSLPVDYWDYLGWRDTLADPKFTERQKSYKGPLGVPMVYTPMMVVNGNMHVNGSDEEKALHVIEKSARMIAATRVPVRVLKTDGELVIEVGPHAGSAVAKDATLWLALVAQSVSVPITRGENRGKTVTYYNVVRELVPLGTWNGQPLTVRRTLPKEGEHCAAFLQQGKGGPIIGATAMASF